MIDYAYYLSRDWVLGEYECWAFVCDYYERELGVKLPLINLGVMDSSDVNQAFESHTDVRYMFEEIDSLEHNCVIELGIKRATHVGVYLETKDGPRVLHCRRRTGGLCQPLNEITKALTIFSINRLKQCH